MVFEQNAHRMFSIRLEVRFSHADWFSLDYASYAGKKFYDLGAVFYFFSIQNKQDEQLG